MHPPPHSSLTPTLKKALWIAGCLLLLAGCWYVASQMSSQPVVSGEGSDTSSANARLQGAWILPVEGLEWQHARLLSIFAFSQDLNPALLTITLNGHELTDDFFPASAFKQGGWGGAEPSTSSEKAATLVSRVQAILQHEDLRPGENVLVASYQASGATKQIVRRFRFQPEGRLIRCRVSRLSRDGEDRAAGARIVVFPMEGAPPVNFSAHSRHPRLARETRLSRTSRIAGRKWSQTPEQSFVFTRDGQATFYLPVGKYLAIATGGLLDGIDRWEIPATGAGEHTFVIERDVDLPGTVAVDFHVHASPSSDSLLPMSEQIRAFMAAGVDLIISSDHNNITDYRPLISRLSGAAGHIQSIPGVEVSLKRPSKGTLGHWNFWPLVPDPEGIPLRRGQVSGHGALELADVPSGSKIGDEQSVAAMFTAYRQQAQLLAGRAGRGGPESAEILIQLNHPRGIQFDAKENTILRAHDWFNVMGFDPDAPLPDHLGHPAADDVTSLDFDVLEIWNRSSRQLYREVRADWFSLLNRGLIRSAAANTDTHMITPTLAGYPLNIVFLEPDQPDGVNVRVEDLVTAVRGGRMLGTDGPIPLLTVHGLPDDPGSAQKTAVPGGMITALDGKVKVHVEVRAASWVPVGETRVWINGDLAERSRDSSLTFETTLMSDAWIVAEVGDLEGIAEDATLPGIYGRLVPRGLALGFTNPVMVDVDGNGVFDAPS